MIDGSLYDDTFEFGKSLKNGGFDYSDVLLKRSVSNYLYRNENLSGFLEYLNELIVNDIESTKKVRVFKNFTVDKNYKKIN